MGGRAWTKKEDRALMDGIGVFSIAWFRKQAGRTGSYQSAPYRSRDAIYRHARKLIGPGGLKRGTHSLRQASLETGYNRAQIIRAQQALGQKWKRLSPRGDYLITFEQLDEIVGWLRTGYWCVELRLYGCVNCGDDRKPTRGNGQCPKCYWRLRNLAKKSGIPTRLSLLRAFVQSLDDQRAQMRLIREYLERGWGLTEIQIRHLIAISSS